jgi:hypothetical protein
MQNIHAMCDSRIWLFKKTFARCDMSLKVLASLAIAMGLIVPPNAKASHFNISSVRFSCPAFGPKNSSVSLTIGRF